MNQTAVPLGSTVTIANGLRPNLGYLLDCNQATYNIKSGTDWHLLYIKATQSGEGWSFALLSDKVEDVAKLYKDTSEGGSGQLPKLVDFENRQVLPYIVQPPYNTPAGYPTFNEQYREAANALESDLYALTSAYPPDGWQDWNKAVLSYYANLLQMTSIRETGVHIYQIAYHRIIPGTPPTAEIVQVARSDFHFWPVPNLPIWSREDRNLSLSFGTCSPE